MHYLRIIKSLGDSVLFVVDDLHLDFRNTGRLRELFKKIRTTLLHDGDMWGMVSTGPSSIAIDVNYDMKRFDEAMKKITGSALKPNEIIEAPQSSQGPSEVRYRAQGASAWHTAENVRTGASGRYRVRVEPRAVAT